MTSLAVTVVTAVTGHASLFLGTPPDDIGCTLSAITAAPVEQHLQILGFEPGPMGEGVLCSDLSEVDGWTTAVGADPDGAQGRAGKGRNW